MYIYIYTECITLSSPKMSNFGVCVCFRPKKSNAASERTVIFHISPYRCNWTTVIHQAERLRIWPRSEKWRTPRFQCVFIAVSVRFGWRGLGRFCGPGLRKDETHRNRSNRFFFDQSSEKMLKWHLSPLYGNTTIFFSSIKSDQHGWNDWNLK